MRRTIQTALRSLDWLIEKGVPIQAHAGWQGMPMSLYAYRVGRLALVLNAVLIELSTKPCDTGTAIPALKAEFPQIDFSFLDPVYPDKTSPAGAAYAYNRRAVVARGQKCLAELRGRPEKAIIAVSHSGFLRQGMTGSWFFNADYRIFDFAGEGLELKQWDVTRRGGMGKSFEETVVVGDDIPEEDVGWPAGLS